MNDISLEDLNSKEWMSVRAFNVLKNNGILSLSQLLNRYSTNTSFTDFRNCGKKTQEEIIEICQKYSSQDLKDLQSDNSENRSAKSTASQLSPFKKQILNQFIENKFSSLGVRSQNGLIAFMQLESSTGVILREVIIRNINFLDIKNIGKTTLLELEIFKNVVIQFINKLSKLDESSLTIEYLKLIIESYFKNTKQSIGASYHEFINSGGKIKLFTLFDFLITNNFIFNESRKLIFNFLYKRPTSEKLTLEEIASRVNLTRERVRQIKVSLGDEIISNCSFINSLIIDDLAKYNHSSELDVMLIDEISAENLNKFENVSFNYQFYSLIFSQVFNKSHLLFGAEEEIAKDKQTKRNRKYRNRYLIRIEIANSFDFSRFIKDVLDKITDRITESYQIYFEGFLYEFMVSKESRFNPHIVYVASFIIFHEFDLVISPDGFLPFQRNTKKLNSQYAEEILEENEKLMTIEDITQAILDKYPELDPTADSIRASLNREREIFFYIGRTSTYGLRKWENETLKGGTIRDIVEEYLISHVEPKHIFEIAQFVKKFRNTNEKNILSNLMLEGDNKRFNIYEGGFVGLISKNYPIDKLKFVNVKGFHFTLERLNKFRGKSIEDLINSYITRYGYKRAQIQFILDSKKEAGQVRLSENNIIL